MVGTDIVEPQSKHLGIFGHITLKMTSSLNLQEVLVTITQGLVDGLGAAFARIWLLGPGDLCSVCYKAADCSNREICLHLKASAGMYTNLNGEYRRVPLGALKIGQIAQGWGPMYTNDILSEDRLPNKQWMRENLLRSFAGYPLIFRGELLGVVAMFSRRIMSQEEFDCLAVFANHAAIAIKNAQLFSELEKLNNQLQAETIYLQEEIKTEYNFEEIIGQSAALQKVESKVEQVAPTDATVLIQGETGTGKELLARAIHNLSPRKDRTLVKVNCGAISAGLVESELFGHEKGAFTGALQRRIGRFELANGGTIFLDEVAELPLDTQVKLLRVLQEGEFERVGGSHIIKVDVRVIVATNRDLKKAVQEGLFRSDLFYRLNVFPILFPALRERKEDIPLLARYFAVKYGAKFDKKIQTIPQKTMDILLNYSWPGNVRELENIVERAVILTKSTGINIDESMLGLENVLQPSGSKALEDVEREHILDVLDETDWIIDGKGGAASILNMNPSTLRSRMKKLGIRKK